MRRAIRLIAGLSFATLLGACAGNSVNAQETNPRQQETNPRQPAVQVTRQPAVQVTRQPAVQVTRQPWVQVTRQPAVQVTRQPAVQVTRGWTSSVTESGIDPTEATMECEMNLAMNLARERFKHVDMDIRSMDLDVRQKESQLPGSGDTDVDARPQDAADPRGVKNVGAAKSLKHTPLISHVDKKNQGGSAH